MYVNASDSSARVLMPCNFYSGCHLFIPISYVSYDSDDELKERSPWTIDAILAGKSKAAITPELRRSTRLEDAQGIAHFSLFGSVVLKKAVQGMLSLVSI
jgi:hypothetical protein